MITPQQAYNIVVLALPDVTFEEKCLDYKDCWSFVYSTGNKNDFPELANRVFVDKKTGMLIRNDILFDAKRWNRSRDVSDEVTFSIGPKLGKAREMLSRSVLP